MAVYPLWQPVTEVHCLLTRSSVDSVTKTLGVPAGTNREYQKMNTKYRMLIDRSGAPIEQVEPGFFGWTSLQWFTINTDGAIRNHAAPAVTSGNISVGLALGHAFQYFTQVANGRAPLAGVVIDTTSNGKRVQLNFRDTSVVSTTVVNGVGNVDIAYESVRYPG